MESGSELCSSILSRLVLSRLVLSRLVYLPLASEPGGVFFSFFFPWRYGILANGWMDGWNGMDGTIVDMDGWYGLNGWMM